MAPTEAAQALYNTDSSFKRGCIASVSDQGEKGKRKKIESIDITKQYQITDSATTQMAGCRTELRGLDLPTPRQRS